MAPAKYMLFVGVCVCVECVSVCVESLSLFALHLSGQKMLQENQSLNFYGI